MDNQLTVGRKFDVYEIISSGHDYHYLNVGSTALEIESGDNKNSPDMYGASEYFRSSVTQYVPYQLMRKCGYYLKVKEVKP